MLQQHAAALELAAEVVDPAQRRVAAGNALRRVGDDGELAPYRLAARALLLDHVRRGFEGDGKGHCFFGGNRLLGLGHDKEVGRGAGGGELHVGGQHIFEVELRRAVGLHDERARAARGDALANKVARVLAAVGVRDGQGVADLADARGLEAHIHGDLHSRCAVCRWRGHVLDLHFEIWAGLHGALEDRGRSAAHKVDEAEGLRLRSAEPRLEVERPHVRGGRGSQAQLVSHGAQVGCRQGECGQGLLLHQGAP
mmetsp:Transcript_25093/g.73667  ORF Transcript_25093/g.73667 Transcript_25093/m.73667 type:complete len:254 (+) Transcript_25093:179-940(+)